MTITADLNGVAMMNCGSVKMDELFQELKLGGISLFGALAGAQLETIWRYLELRHFTAGQKVFEQGALPEAIYVLVSGKVDFVVEKAGVAQVEASYTEGQTFGESAYLGIQAHVGTAQVRSVSDANVIVLTRNALVDIQQQDQSLFALLMMNLAREVSRKYQAKLMLA